MSGLRVSAPSYVIQGSSIYRLVLFTRITGGRTKCYKSLIPVQAAICHGAVWIRVYAWAIEALTIPVHLWAQEHIQQSPAHQEKHWNNPSDDRCITGTSCLELLPLPLLLFLSPKDLQSYSPKSWGYSQRSKVRFTLLCSKRTKQKMKWWKSENNTRSTGTFVQHHATWILLHSLQVVLAWLCLLLSCSSCCCAKICSLSSSSASLLARSSSDNLAKHQQQLQHKPASTEGSNEASLSISGCSSCSGARTKNEHLGAMPRSPHWLAEGENKFHGANAATFRSQISCTKNKLLPVNSVDHPLLRLCLSALRQTGHCTLQQAESTKLSEEKEGDLECHWPVKDIEIIN